MVLAILVFLVVSGSVLGAYVALLRLPGFMAGRQLEQRLKDLNDVDGESPGATTVVLSQAPASTLSITTVPGPTATPDWSISVDSHEPASLLISRSMPGSALACA